MHFIKLKFFFDSTITLLRNRWFPFALGLPLFFSLHHYKGIVGDARLYLLQVIHNWQPDRFVNDPPFMFGNQDSYSIFSTLYGLVIKVFPIDSGTFCLTLFGHFLWFCAAFYFISQFARKLNIRLWFVPLFFTFILYSGDNMPNSRSFFFYFVEVCNVSRSYAVSIAILGFGLLFAKKKWLCLGIILFGTCLHPLTAGWLLPLWIFFYYPKARKIIVALSALLPFTFVLHTGPFDIYPADWGNCTHDHPITYLMLWRQFLAVLFFGVFVPKFTQSYFLLKFSKATSSVFIIGFIWSAVGHVEKLILIYQIQAWRIEWMFFILAMPTFVYIIYEQLKQMRRQKHFIFTTKHVSLLLIAFASFMPAPCSFCLIVAIILLMMPTKKWNMFLSLFVLTVFCVLSAGLQEYMKTMLQGGSSLGLIEYVDLYKSTDNLLLLQFMWLWCIIVYCARRIAASKKFFNFNPFCITVLLLYCLMPQFQLLPMALMGCYLYFNKRIKLFLLIAILIICFWDGFFNSELRETQITFGFPSQIKNSAVYLVPILIFYTLYFLKLPKVVLGVAGISCIIGLSIPAIESYDKRSESLRKSDSYLENFRHTTIFPQISNRGRMFYYVQGDYVDESRTQFLTGSYFSETTPIGEALFQKQFEEERKRLNYLFFKKQRGFIAKRGDWKTFVKESLSNRDTLLDRVTFLCSIKEISHLVSNLQFKELPKEDTYKMSESETINLYGCPRIK